MLRAFALLHLVLFNPTSPMRQRWYTFLALKLRCALARRRCEFMLGMEDVAFGQMPKSTLCGQPERPDSENFPIARTMQKILGFA